MKAAEKEKSAEDRRIRPASRTIQRFSSRRFVAGAGQPVAVFAAASGLAFYIAYHLTRFHLSVIWPPHLRDDAAIIFNSSRRVFVESGYPADMIFPYPPSAALIFAALGAGGPVVFMSIWYVLMVAALVSIPRACLVQEPRELQAAGLLIGLVAILLADSPISWDLRGANSNLIILGLIISAYALLGARPIIAGTLIGLSISLKLYSLLLLPWLLINARWRALGAAVAAVLVLWIVLPVLLFGFEGALHVYAGWQRELLYLRDPLIHAHSSAELPIVSVQHAIMHIMGVTYDAPAMLAPVAVLWACWLAALLLYAWRYRPLLFARTPAPSRAALADWVVLLLAPLPLNPWLEPNHCVPLLPAAVLALVVALDETVAQRDRLAATIAVGALALFTVGKVPFAVRGLGLEALFIVLVLVFAFLRPRLKMVAERPVAAASGALAGAAEISN